VLEKRRRERSVFMGGQWVKIFVTKVLKIGAKERLKLP
jgi:hypothetical protein